MALVSQQVLTVLLLLNRGANPNILDNNGCNGLHHATNFSVGSVVESLITNRCSVNHVNNDGDTPLIVALNNEITGIVTLLLKNGADVNVVDSNGSSCLHLAVTLTTLLEELVKLGLDINKEDSNGNTPLMVAVKRECEFSAKILMANDACISTVNKSGFSLLHYAAQTAQNDLMLELIDRGADVNKKTNGGETPLLLHLQYWYLQRTTIKILVDKGADLDTIEQETGNSLLHLAVDKGNIEMLEMLLSRTSTINFQNNEGDTALHMAIKRGHTVSTAQLFLSKNADPNIPDHSNNTCLHSAVLAGEASVVRALLKHGANTNGEFFALAQRLGHVNLLSALLINATTHDDYMAVFSSIANGEINTLKRLTANGYDINVQDRNGNTPLLYALENVQIAIVDYLLTTKVDVTICNNAGYTCLHRAVRLGDVRIVRQLLAKGCDINAVTLTGESSLLLAIISRHLHIVQLLLDFNAKVDAVPPIAEGSCLHAACKYASHGIVSRILQNGCDINQLSASGLTPFMQALDNNNREVALILIESAADIGLITELGCLSSAVHLQYLDVINLLLDKGAPIDYMHGSYTALKHAIQSKKRASVKLLLSRGADVHIGKEQTSYPLHLAAQNEMDDVVSFILDEGFDINKKNNCNCSPLFAAANNKNVSTVNMLLAKGAAFDTFDDDFTSFLGIAARNGWEELVGELIASGADIHHQNDDGFAPLELAMLHRHVNVVKLLFSAIIAQVHTDWPQTYLHSAAAFGDNKIVIALLDNGYDINKLNAKGETPLLLSLKKEKLSTSKLLLAKGADYNVTEGCLHFFAQYAWNDMVLKMLEEGSDVNMRQYDGATPLLIAVQYKNLPTVRILLSHGADPAMQNSDGNTPLHYSIVNNCKRTLKALLENVNLEKSKRAINSAIFSSMEFNYFDLTEILIDYSDCISENESGETVLFVAVKNRCENLVRQILAKYGNVNEINLEGNTLLMAAVENNDLEMVKLLLERGADPNIVNKKGNSCLHCAVHCSEEVLSIFLERCNVELKNFDGDTPLLCALKNACTQFSHMLIESGADIHIEDSMNNSCIHYAVKVGSEKLVKCLKQGGLDINKRNREGDNCLDLAISNGDVDLMKLLVSYGADVHQVNRLGENCLLKSIKKKAKKKTKTCLQNADFVVDLLAKGLDVNQQSNVGMTPFVMALEKANVVYAKMLLAQTVNVHIRNRPGSNLHFAISQKVDVIGELLDLGLDIDEQDDHGDTPLLLALHSGMEATAKLLLRRGASVHITNNGNNSCLHNAIARCKIEMLSTLIDQGADVNCRNLYGENPLLSAVKLRKLNHAKLLLQNGADCDIFDNQNGSCLLYAAKYGYDELVSDFISRGVNIDPPHFNGNAFLAALRGKHANIAKMLIKNGADIHCHIGKDTWLNLLLHLKDTEIIDLILAKGIDVNYRLSQSEPLILTALKEKCRRLVDYLIAKGGNVHLCSYTTGDSCLHYAVAADYEDLVIDFLRKGLDINRENNQRETPLNLAFKEKHSNMIKLLLSHGASVDDDNFQHFYMHYAAEMGDDAIVSELIDRGADVNAVNTDGNTPLFVAVLSNNVGTVKLLIKHGADYNLNNKQGRNLLGVAKSIEADELVIEFTNLGLADVEVDVI